MSLTTVIPTYNEANNLPGLIKALLLLPLNDINILVVDDNSPDGTGQIADEIAKKYHRQISVLHRTAKSGLGTAYLEGFRHALTAGADAIIQMDADFSHPPEILPALVDKLSTCDLVIGSRYIDGGSVDSNWPYWRKALSAFGNTYARSILRIPVHDLTSGFKAWKRDTLLGMPLKQVKSNGYAFQVEMTYIAYRLGCSIGEVPFYFPDREWGRSKMSFDIQREAAVRVWQLLYDYRTLKPQSAANPGVIKNQQ